MGFVHRTPWLHGMWRRGCTLSQSLYGQRSPSSHRLLYHSGGWILVQVSSWKHLMPWGHACQDHHHNCILDAPAFLSSLQQMHSTRHEPGLGT